MCRLLFLFFTTLYTHQMEACDATLQELIAEQLLTHSDVAWSLLDQILDGLAYVHELGIIHRDLKPSNLFLSFEALGPKVRHIKQLHGLPPAAMAKLKIKLGDFGLAKDAAAPSRALRPQVKRATQTWEEFVAESRGHSVSAEGSHAGEESRTPLTAGPESSGLNLSQASLLSEAEGTSDIGTTLYMPPDLNGQWTVKTDMYSLGVTFFEMLHPFRTGMERVVVLRKLRGRTMTVS